MRFIHTSDWHLGRLFHGVHLTEDQRALLLGDFLCLVREEKAELVILAGDVYDRSVPPVEAVALFDEVLTKLKEMGVKVAAIAGNHDSADRVHFGSKLFEDAGLYMRGKVMAGFAPIVLEDAFGKVALSLFPYIDPSDVRAYFGEEELLDFNTATGKIIAEGKSLLPRGRSIAVAHVFLTGGKESASERALSVGGSSDVSYHHFAGYSYTALGHLHFAHKIGAEHIRYSGSLMKYSFDEAEHKKGVLSVELGAQGETTVNFLPLTPRRDVRRVEGKFEELLTDRVRYPKSDDYVCAVLSDEGAILDASRKLRDVYPNLLALERPNLLRGEVAGVDAMREKKELTEEAWFEDFFQAMKGRVLFASEREILTKTMNKALRKWRERA